MWTIPATNPEGCAFVGVITSFLILAFVSFFLRICARRITRSFLDASDYTCLAGLVLTIGLTVVIWGVYSHGWGEDMTHFTMKDVLFASKMFGPTMIIWNAAVTAIRISMLIFYIRIFSVTRWSTAYWFAGGLNLASLISIIFATAFICSPITFSYDRSIPGGHCGNMVAFQRFTAIWNLLMDLTVVLLPMPILWGLQLSKKKKLGLTLILGMGFVICVMTMIRIFVSAYYAKQNITRQNSVVMFITAMEPIIGVLSACLPHLPPVWRRIGHSRAYATLSHIFRTDAASTHKSDGTSGKWAPSASRNSRKRENSFYELRDVDTTSFRLSGVDRNYAIYNESGLGIEFDGIHVLNEVRIERSIRHDGE